MTDSLVSIIIPAFNEKQSLEELCSRISKVFETMNRPFELIFIDDGSTDGTFEKLLDLQNEYPNLLIVRHFKNFGKSLALMQGFDLAEGEIGIMLDADLQDQPEDIPRFIEKLDQGFDHVNGWRSNRKDTFLKRSISKLFNLITTFIFKFNVHDINCGYKAFKKDAYKELNLKGDLHRLIPALIANKGFKVCEIKISHDNRKYGVSKYKLLRHRGLLDIIALAVSFTAQIRPFHFFSELGLAFLLIAGFTISGWALTRDVFSQTAEILILIVGLWSLFVGTILPLFGFFLEIEAYRSQGVEWRSKLIKETILSKSRRSVD
ncbi:MAG: glycosyltransferase family 2 protein [Candidatus Nitrohelix vancouverensis]|uniref:Glycosyltransferase family 2 protein n=1 Tax=Candidatus Nitrohelix vancouverensis TaxID=2705534 RepID=A0A7T0G3J2_9BACT|nr:MAG: glycosyltransferase family 2 protein [Candidatus Nitrohelix vancouverensis]